MEGFLIFISTISAIVFFLYWFRPIFRNDPTNKGLDRLINGCLDSGMKSAKIKAYWTEATFENGYSIRWWSSNKMYAYANEGEIVKPDGSKTYWHGEMPSRSTNRRLLNEANILNFS